ncbi:MAG: hypothetical protein RLZZ387_3254 [Chloroflexota bacterium]
MLRLYNTLTRRVEPFMSLAPGRATMYSCGPTVYRYIHIGNLRTFLMADWLRRSLTALGYEVRHVKNITDVGHMRVERLDQGEDKLIAQARREGKSSADIAAFYTAAFLDDERRMRILPAHILPRATDHVAEMVAITADLLAKGLAYERGGNVYFDIAGYPDYGRLSGNQMAGLLEGVRDAADPLKRSAEDFALWKAAEPGRDPAMTWESPWGRGFPGWHIECSAMAIKHLGPQIDIHTGGVDNIFPHHEGELAQSEGHTGLQFVRHWVHAQHLLADGQKMAKSTGNAYTLADVEARGFEPMALRLLFATVHYRSRLNFTFSALRAAQTALGRMRARVAALQAEAQLTAHYSPNARDTYDWALEAHDSVWHARFVAALEDDLNIPRATAVLWDVLRGREPLIPPEERLALTRALDAVLGFGLFEPPAERRGEAGAARVPEEVLALAGERAALRRRGEYALADALRTRVLDAGWQLRDTRSDTLVLPRAPEEEFGSISRPTDVPDTASAPDLYDISVNLLAHDSRADLERCIESILRHTHGRRLEVVVVDNGSTDDTVAYLRRLARQGLLDAEGRPVGLQVLFADHNMGFAAGRNATLRASRGRIAVLLDTSIELRGDIWAPLETALADTRVGLTGPYGLVTDDLKEFRESEGPDVDAVEGYLMAFRRALLPEVGWLEQKFRFYRLLDIHTSFFFKTAGYRVTALPEVARLLEKHPHREWYALSEEERATRSKRNYDIFKRRWHHGQSLMTANYVPADHWFGHDHPRHLGAHTHPPEELPPPGQPHTHTHQHWADHAHEHPHYHH